MTWHLEPKMGLTLCDWWILVRDLLRQHKQKLSFCSEEKVLCKPGARNSAAAESMRGHFIFVNVL